jgi:hypothetical protein
MTTFNSSRIVVAFSAIALAVSVGTSAAQAPKPTDLLTDKQVKELVATATTPANHVQLQKHFLALWAKYDAEAAKHADLAESHRKNANAGSHFPGNHSLQAKHCDRLSASLREAANEARELASEHERMAAGDHAQLQKHFLGVAAKYDAEAAKHAGLAESHRKNAYAGSHFPGNHSLQARHCDRLSASLREAANEARETASEHERMITVN